MSEKYSRQNITRREFLKIVGISTVASSTILTGCQSGDKNKGDIQVKGEILTDKMTMRENPKTKEKVSLLGYGCMRWPTLPAP